MCGIGGRTILEAQMRMPATEYLEWCKYRAKYGSFNVGMRIDRAVGRALANYFSANSRKSYSIEDFSPYDKAIMDAMSIDAKIDMALSHFPRVK